MKKINFQPILKISEVAYGKEELPNIDLENERAARQILRNWIGAATWGLSRQHVVEMLESEARNLKEKSQ